MCLIDIEEVNYVSAVEHLKKAEIFRKKIKRPKERDIIFMIKNRIWNKMKVDNSLKEIFFNYL